MDSGVIQRNEALVTCRMDRSLVRHEVSLIPWRCLSLTSFRIV